MRIMFDMIIWEQGLLSQEWHTAIFLLSTIYAFHNKYSIEHYATQEHVEFIPRMRIVI